MLRKSFEFLTKLGMVLLHIAAAFLFTLLSLAYLVPWTGIPEIAAIVALFISLPILIIGVCSTCLSMATARIPTLGWVGVIMMLATGVFLVAIILIF